MAKINYGEGKRRIRTCDGEDSNDEFKLETQWNTDSVPVSLTSLYVAIVFGSCTRVRFIRNRKEN